LGDIGGGVDIVGAGLRGGGEGESAGLRDGISREAENRTRYGEAGGLGGWIGAGGFYRKDREERGSKESRADGCAHKNGFFRIRHR